MALSEDRRALLQLLVDGDTYEGVAGLTGAGESEIRARAHESVAELEAVGETDFAAAVRRRLSELDDPTPGAQSPSTSVAGAPDGGSNRRLPAIILAAAAAIAIGVGAFVVIRGDSGSNDSPAASSQGEDTRVQIKLEPVDAGSGASGTANLLDIEDLPVIDFDARGLEPSGAGQTYVAWLLGSGQLGLPFAFQAVGPDGRFEGRTRIPAAASGLLPSFQTVELTLASQDEASAAVDRAAKSGSLPRRVGVPVLRGDLHN